MSLRESLPEVRGRYSFDAAMSDQTWFRVGGSADVLYKPADLDDLIHFLKNRPESVPLYVVGAGSNLLVRDGGVRGVVIRLGRGFSTIERDGLLVTVGAAALDRTVAMSCGQWGMSGLEFLVGVPGTIGGAVKMNAGCYGAETKDRLVWVDVLNFDGMLHRLTPDQLEMTYRHSNLRPDQIVIAAQFYCDSGDTTQILSRLDQLLAEREASQPIRGRTGGSTFRNPGGQSAWKLIDEAGCRGLMVGQAQVSEKHTNFLLNTDHCSATDLEELGELVRQKVRDKSGHDLCWEIVRMGEKQS